MNQNITVGTVFHNSGDRGWRDDQGNRHRHTYTLECVVTEITPDGFEWERTAILEEANLPPENAFTPTKGSMAWFGFEASVERGDTVVIG